MLIKFLFAFSQTPTVFGIRQTSLVHIKMQSPNGYSHTNHAVWLLTYPEGNAGSIPSTLISFAHISTNAYIMYSTHMCH